jgi:hypothetical protein
VSDTKLDTCDRSGLIDGIEGSDGRDGKEANVCVETSGEGRVILMRGVANLGAGGTAGTAGDTAGGLAGGLRPCPYPLGLREADIGFGVDKE